MFITVAQLAERLQTLIDMGHGDALLDIDWSLDEMQFYVQEADGHKWLIQRRANEIKGPSQWGDL